jgi:peptidoglycan DL-endopeptidase CwlO
MAGRRRPWGAAAAAASIALALTVAGVPLTATAAPHADVPTPAEIAAAKRNEAAKQAEITKIGGLLQQYQQQSDAATSDAQAKGELYNLAAQNLAAATQKAQDLSDQQKAAAKTAAASQKKAGAIIAQLARTGGGDLTLDLFSGSGKDTDQLLQRLGAMNRLSASSQEILEKAQFDQNTASSLAKQAASAKSARADRAQDAQDALSAAQAAAEAANAKVASTEASQTTMYAQLADLKGTTATLEAEAAQAAAAQAAALAAAQQAASSGKGTSGSSGGGSDAPPSHIDPSAPAPNANAVNIAIAYARAQIGKPYVWGGAGPDSFDCSGLTMRAYEAAGIGIGGHSSTRQYYAVRLVPRSAGIQPGDLIFYSSADSLKDGIIDHVTLATGGGRMIEAPRAGVPVRDYPIYLQDILPYVGRPTG